MILTELSRSWFSLLPPLVAIGLAVITRRIMVSLLLGTVTGAWLLAQFSVLDTFIILSHQVIGLFWSWANAQLNVDKVCILAFLLMLGSMYSLISFSGGSIAFSRWIALQTNSSRKAQLVTLALGLVLFIDDYFNVLVTGNTCRIVTDKQKVSRAKLAYILDSTAAPACMITLFSSRGAYIVSLLSAVILTYNITGFTPFITFLLMVPLNFYALASLGMVLIVVCCQFDIFLMARHERAAYRGTLYDRRKGTPPGNIIMRSNDDGEVGKVSHFLFPVLMLAAVTILAMFITGIMAMDLKGKAFSFFGALKYTDVSVSLLAGALAGFFTSLFQLLPKRPYARLLFKTMLTGLRNMLGAIAILLLVWLLVDVIKHVGTGNYLAGLIAETLDIRFIPALIFLVAFGIAFATGSSLGAFGIIIPVAANLVAGIDDIVLFVPVMSAAVAGAIFGDHCSPVSDTTVLSSIGAGCHHIDHVLTQLPYSLLSGLVSLIGYIVMGFSFSPFMGAWAALGAFFLVFLLLHILKVLRMRYRPDETIIED